MRFVSLLRFGAVALSFLVTQTSQAQPCSWEVFSPKGALELLRYELANRNISIVPARFLGLAATEPDFVLRSGAVVGRLRYSQSVRLAQSRLEVSDPAGQPLGVLTQVIRPCPFPGPRGRCEEVRLETELDHATTEPSFRLVLGPGGNFFYRYGKEQNPVVWRSDFRGSLLWLADTLTEGEGAFLPTLTSERSALPLALASDPLVAPSLPRLQILYDAGTTTVIGRVPSNAVYGAIVQRALDLGIYNIRMEVIIDTGMPQPLILVPPLLECF